MGCLVAESLFLMLVQLLKALYHTKRFGNNNINRHHLNGLTKRFDLGSVCRNPL